MADTQAAIDYHGFLEPNDGVGISFWIISIAMVAATVFFFFEAMSVAAHWKTSLHVGMLVTLIAGVHYFYMREYWVTIKQTPIVYRYIDWSLTVPLQMVEFYLILKAVKPDLSSIMFWRLLLGTVLMLAFGYLGEQSIVNPWVGFAVGMAGWFFILFEIFVLNPAKEDAGQYVSSAFSTMRFIVTVGWSIYPLGYYFGYLVGAVDDNALNLVYNIADLLNKIWFCLAIWHAAKQDTAAQAKEALLA
jgi:bacteriorhodopsin